MIKKIDILPPGYHTVTPYLIIRDATSAIEFYKKVFDATEIMRMTMPDGKIGFAEITIGNSLNTMIAAKYGSHQN